MFVLLWHNLPFNLVWVLSSISSVYCRTVSSVAWFILALNHGLVLQEQAKVNPRLELSLLSFWHRHEDKIEKFCFCFGWTTVWRPTLNRLSLSTVSWNKGNFLNYSLACFNKPYLRLITGCQVQVAWQAVVNLKRNQKFSTSSSWLHWRGKCASLKLTWRYPQIQANTLCWVKVYLPPPLPRRELWRKTGLHVSIVADLN